MEVIQSFTIDHTKLKPGIYVSRRDKGFTTYDLRITEPNKEPAVAPAAIHSLEHLMATWFRNSRVKDDVVYVGPMGCLLLHDLPMCKWECRRYLDRLKNDFHSEYEKLQVVLGDGKVFADA